MLEGEGVVDADEPRDRPHHDDGHREQDGQAGETGEGEGRAVDGRHGPPGLGGRSAARDRDVAPPRQPPVVDEERAQAREHQEHAEDARHREIVLGADDEEERVLGEEREAPAQDGRRGEVRHRQGEDHHRRLQQAGRHQRQRDRAQDLEIAGTEIARAVLEVPVERGQDVLDHEEGQREEGEGLAHDDARPPQDPDVGPEGLVHEPAAAAEDDERDPEHVGGRDQGQERDEPERPAEPPRAARHRQGHGEADADGQRA